MFTENTHHKLTLSASLHRFVDRRDDYTAKKAFTIRLGSDFWDPACGSSQHIMLPSLSGGYHILFFVKAIYSCTQSIATISIILGESNCFVKKNRGNRGTVLLFHINLGYHCVTISEMKQQNRPSVSLNMV